MVLDCISVWGVVDNVQLSYNKALCVADNEQRNR